MAKFTPEELQIRLDDYFKSCDDNKKLPNKAGVCVDLDITRETYREWKKNKVKGLSDTLKKAEMKIEEAWVQRLNHNAPTGAIFYLKNAFKDDYKDRVDQDITSGGLPIPILGNGIYTNNSNKKDTKPEQKN